MKVNLLLSLVAAQEENTVLLTNIHETQKKEPLQNYEIIRNWRRKFSFFLSKFLGKF